MCDGRDSNSNWNPNVGALYISSLFIFGRNMCLRRILHFKCYQEIMGKGGLCKIVFIPSMAHHTDYTHHSGKTVDKWHNLHIQ